MSSSQEARVTLQVDASATWFVGDLVIRVLSVRLSDGAETELPDAPSLGECFDIMPRGLWDRVRYEHESPTYAALGRGGGQQ
jgi:hypothetical protein